MKYTFSPAGPRTQAASGPTGRPAVAMRPGEVHEVSDEWAARLVAIVPGKNGGPCLVPFFEPAATPEPAPKGKPGPKPKPVAETPDPGTETT